MKKWIVLVFFLLVSGHAFAQLSIGMGNSYIFSDSNSPQTIGITNVHVPGYGNFDAYIKFNPITLGFDIIKATLSETDIDTASFGGYWTCQIVTNGVMTSVTHPIIVQPWGKDLVIGGALYLFTGKTDTRWNYEIGKVRGLAFVAEITKAIPISSEDSGLRLVQGQLAEGETTLSDAIFCLKPMPS